MKCCRYRILFPVKVDNLLWWASVLMFIGAIGFNISNIAGVLYGDVPLNLTVNQQVCMADVISFCDCFIAMVTCMCVVTE